MLRTLLLLAVLGAILAGSIWFAWVGWWGVEAVAETPISTHGYVAMALGIVLSVVVGAGLMALLFYSARHGHDDIDHDL